MIFASHWSFLENTDCKCYSDTSSEGPCMVTDSTYYRPCNSDILKFILGSESWGNKTKEIYYSLLSLKMISFVLFPQALKPSVNCNNLNRKIGVLSVHVKDMVI